MEQKVSGSNPSLASRRLGNFFNLVEMVPVLESEKTIGSERRGMGSAFCMLCPNYTGPLTFTARKVTRLKETSTFITSFFFCGWGGGGGWPFLRGNNICGFLFVSFDKVHVTFHKGVVLEKRICSYIGKFSFRKRGKKENTRVASPECVPVHFNISSI